MNESDCPLSKTRKILWQIWTKRKFYCTQKELQSEKCVVYIISRVKKYTTKHPSATTMHRAETTCNSWSIFAGK